MNGKVWDGETNWIRWAARTLGTLFAGLWLVIGIVSIVAGEAPLDWESYVLGVLILDAAVSVAAAWRWELIGGACVLGSGVAHSVFAVVVSDQSRGVTILIAGVLFLVSGALFLWSWRRSGGSGPGQAAGRNGPARS
jgi:hypothetical protein